MEQRMGEEKAKYVHSVFESIARDYDRMNSIISFGRHKSWRKFTMKQMGVKSGEKAIDVCCGTCDWTIDLAKKVGSNGKIVGLDFSQNMLDIGLMKIQEEAVSQRTQLINGDAMAIPFADNSFDYATIGFALRNVPDYRHVLSEMRRVVKPGGQVVSLEVSKPLWSPYRKLFYFYFFNVLPIFGKILVNKYEQYNWLPQSLINFPDSKQLKADFEDAGLKNVQTHLFAGGVAALHIGIK